MITGRRSGILLHITSLPGSHGIGGLGAAACDFIDFLVGAGQAFWQFLPINPTSPSFDNSPYMSLSAFAGNPLLIDPDQLLRDGYLNNGDLTAKPDFSDYIVEFNKVIPYKNTLLLTAFNSFCRSAPPAGFADFCQREKWLDEYALFMSLRQEFNNQPWYEWPLPLARRDQEQLALVRVRLDEQILYYKFEQFCFHEQWDSLRNYARQNGISLIGDIPIYVALDSADVWANQEIFKLDPETMTPTHVSGVPPDYFSKTGQRWGTPLYSWQGADHRANVKLYDWWQQRFAHIKKTMDMVRIDHFRGFESFWQIPAAEETAVNGLWVQGPGKNFFDEMKKELGVLPIIAEDLGIITPAVEKLRDSLGFPGMKVLQFAFDADETNLYLPHNYQNTNCVVYTGTHDNNTTLGWYLSDKASPAARRRIAHYTNKTDSEQIHWDFIRLAYASIARLAIVPLQDVLGFGADCRMNTPGTCDGNWRWRCAPRFINENIKRRLRDESEFYGRTGKEAREQE